MTYKKETMKNILHALRGWFFWMRYHRKKVLNHEDLVIFFPENDTALYEAAMLYLDDLLISRLKKKACILYVSDDGKSFFEQQKRNIKNMQKISEDTVKDLLLFYRLVDFSPDFFCASFKYPFGRRGDLLVKDFDADFNILFALGIYKIAVNNSRMEEQLIGGIRK